MVVKLKQQCASAMMGPASGDDGSQLTSGGGAVVVRRGGQDVARTGRYESKQGAEDRAVRAAGHDVSSSHDTVQRTVMVRPRTICLITAIVVGLAVGWVV